MQVRERQPNGGVTPAAPPAGRGITKRGRSRPTKPVAISAAILGVLVLVTLGVTDSGVSSRRDARPASAAVVETSDFTIAEPSRLQRAVTWIDGLAAGLILPHEVTSRMAVQNPALAKAVEAAWADLRSAPASELRRAVRWIDGLAAGLIQTHEITSRLAAQDPGLARVVQAAWSDLAPVAGRVPAG